MIGMSNDEGSSAADHQRYPWPDGISDEERNDMLVGGENDLLANAHQLRVVAKAAGTQRHLMALLRRHLMIRECRRWIERRMRKTTTPLTTRASVKFAIHVNTFYVQTAGALDNLAWALIYEFALLPSPSEEDREAQQTASLRSRTFRRLLGTDHPLMSQRIELSIEWHSEMSKLLRDHAVHRMPLSVVSGIMTTDEGEEAGKMMTQAGEQLAQGDYDGWSALFLRAQSLGVFQPWLENPNGITDGMYYLPNLIARESAFYLDLVGSLTSLALCDLGERPVNSSGRPGGKEPWALGAYLKPREPWRSPLE